MNSGKKLVLVFIFHLTFACNCLKVIPERTYITYVNETYFTNVSATIRRISRGGDYVANLQFVAKLSIGNDVTVDMIFYEYLHNEYRRSFVEMHYKTCNLILKDLYIGSILRKAGLSTCPILPGKISLKNVNLNNDIPSVWPFEKGKVEIICTDTSTGSIMARGEVMMTFKPK